MLLRVNNKVKLKHMGTVDLKTDRFILRRFQPEDLHDVYENWSSDYDSAKYNAWSVHENEAITKSYLEEWILSYKRLNYYHWAILDKDNNEVIGSISVSKVNDRKKYCEVGYTVAKKKWNQGIATEILKKVIEFLTLEVGFETIRAMHDIRNVASGRVMEKSGMKYVKNQMYFFLSKHNIFMNCSVYEYKKK